MKVLHVLDSLNRGGTETLVLDICRNARDAGLDLTLVATGGGDLEADFAAACGDYVRLQRKAAFDIRLVRNLRAVIRERQPEIIHCHQAVEAMHAYFASVGTGARRVLSFHLGTLDRKNRVALRFLVPRMDANIAVSRDLLRHLGEGEGFDVERNFCVIRNGVDPARLKASGRDVRAELGLTRDHLLFGMTGNFYTSARKDQMTVCRALPRLFAHAPHARFAFVGGCIGAEGQRYFDECVAYCRAQGIIERVHFLGKRADVSDILAALDGFVFSSRHEGLGIALIEAMMVGVPSIISDIGVLIEASGGGEYARVFRTGDAADLAEKMCAFAVDADARRDFGAQAQTWARGEYGIATHIEELKRLYLRLGASKGELSFGRNATVKERVRREKHAP